MKFYPTLDSDSVRPYLPAHPLLLPASSWARQLRGPDGALPVPHIPAQVPEIAADSGGFAASLRAKKLGLEDGYGYTPDQYVAWLEALGERLSWAATFDWCCEPQVAADERAVRDHQDKTTEMAWLFWQRYRQTNIVWVPTIQGWTVADYQRHARDLRSLIERMARYYQKQPVWRVGIGTLCKRTRVETIRRVVEAVAEELPGIPLHCWGVSLRTLQAPFALLSQAISFDSSSWNGLFARDREAWRVSGLKQREWSILFALPKYLERVERAWSRPKQFSLPVKKERRRQEEKHIHRIGWNMAADDTEPLPAHWLSALSMDVAKQEYPDKTDEERYVLANVFINGYYGCFARRDERKRAA